MPAPKTLVEFFRDWESHVFGYGYGTGEHWTVPALCEFFALTADRGRGGGKAYDHGELENHLGGTVAWLLINIFAHADVIEYGTSPRYGWLTPQGEALREFVLSKRPDELIAMTETDEEYAHCTPDYCNCDGDQCANPFWTARRVAR